MTTLTALDIDKIAPATFTAPGPWEEEFMALVAEAPDCSWGYAADGTVIVIPPTDPESGAGVMRICLQLGTWAENHGGLVAGPDSGFFLPGGSRRPSDASWFDKKRWEAAQAAAPHRVFPNLAPDL
jgi:Uma2 family endonuclease